MDYSKYIVECIKCKSRTTLLSQESNPIIFVCKGCGSGVIVQGHILYVVDRKYLDEICRDFNMNICGHIVKCDVSNIHPNSSKNLSITTDKRPITDKDVQRLKKILSDSEDSSSIISML